MSHITKLINKSAYEPFNELQEIDRYDPPKISLFRMAANLLDRKKEMWERDTYTAERKENVFPVKEKKNYERALFQGERNTFVFLNKAHSRNESSVRASSLRYDFESGRTDLDKLYPDLPIKELFKNAIQIKERLAHHYGMVPDFHFEPEGMAVYGTVVNTRKMPEVDQADVKGIKDEMQHIGINAYIIGIEHDQIFVPHYKVGLLETNPELEGMPLMPKAESDPQSRILLLAYLQYKNLLSEEDQPLIDKTFSARDKRIAETFDIGALLAHSTETTEKIEPQV